MLHWYEFFGRSTLFQLGEGSDGFLSQTHPHRCGFAGGLQGPLRGMKWISGSGINGRWLGSYEHHKQRLFYAAIERKSVAVGYRR